MVTVGGTVVFIVIVIVAVTALFIQEVLVTQWLAGTHRCLWGWAGVKNILKFIGSVILLVWSTGKEDLLIAGGAIPKDNGECGTQLPVLLATRMSTAPLITASMRARDLLVARRVIRKGEGIAHKALVILDKDRRRGGEVQENGLD